MNMNALTKVLAETVLWENVSQYVESTEQVNILLQKVGLSSIDIERAEILESEDFIITSTKLLDGKILISFEMPFIISVNKTYSIEAVACGNLEIPDHENFAYDEYDFSSMNRAKLLSFGSIISITDIDYEDAEFIGTW